MRLLLLLALATMAACATTSYSTVDGTRLPRNINPNACYVRMVTPDIYDTLETRYLTYDEDAAIIYPHRERRLLVKPELSRWEATFHQDCTSSDPNDCQVLCYRTYPAEITTIYEPTDSTLGQPEERMVATLDLISKGGLVSYEEVDCALKEYQPAGITFAANSAVLTEEARRQIDDRLYAFLMQRPYSSVLIAVHTSRRASSADCFRLTDRRAASVADYLVSRGIRRERLLTESYGAHFPVFDCPTAAACTPEQHAVNDRVLFRLM